MPIFLAEISENGTPSLQKQIMENFKSHFTTAQREIKRSQQQQKIRDFGFHQQGNVASLANEVYAIIAAKQAENTAQAESINAKL